LIGLIQDHGLESPYHRGQFYGCFRGGWLSGVALVGYRVMMSGDRERSRPLLKPPVSFTPLNSAGCSAIRKRSRTFCG
jgi:hypothetical protein